MRTPTQAQIDNGTFKKFDGKWYKLCTGPSHEISTYLPATEKYFYVHKSVIDNGKLTARCRLCANWEKLKVKGDGSEHGYVPIGKVQHVFIEAINRCGASELARRTGIGRDSLVKIAEGKQRNVRRANVRKVMLELISMKRKREFPVSKGARWRSVKRLSSNETEFCAGCGTPHRNFTDGCKTCWDRKNRRKIRLQV